MNATRQPLLSAGLSSVSLLLSVAFLVSGCTADSAPEGGGTGEEPPAADDELPLVGADDDHPCGAATVADVRASNGNRLQLCSFSPGLEGFVETGPTGRDSAITTMAPERDTCALEILLATTSADVPVPRALLGGCADVSMVETATLTRTVVDGPVTTWIGDFGPSPRGNFCGASGAAQFAASGCYECNPYDDCADWCITELWGWHDRNLSGWMGEEGNIGMEHTAACVGQVRARAYYAEDAGDGWQTKIDKIINPGTSSTYGLIYHSAAIFGQDYDIRLRATSHANGGVHRHSGYFLDE
jgi:hypothetical protein